MIKSYDGIEPKFYRGANHPTAKTVRELIDILARLPGDMRLSVGMGRVSEVIVTKDVRSGELFCFIDEHGS